MVLILSIISINLLINIFDNVYENLQLRKEVVEEKQKNQDLLKKNEKIKKDIANYNNEEYVLRIARSRYMYSKESDEQIFKVDINKTPKEDTP